MSDFNVLKAENAAARYFEARGVRFCNAENALVTVFEALGLSFGDEVVVSANLKSDISAFLSKSGVRVVFADVNENFFDVSAEDVLSKLTNRTKAAAVSHRFGRICDMGNLSDRLLERGITLVEETVCGIGAVRFSGGKILRVGSVGIGCIIEREFALICSENEVLAEKLPESDVAAAEKFLRHLPDFETENGKRRLAVRRFGQLLYEKNLTPFVSFSVPDKNVFSSCPCCPLFVKNRDALKTYLDECGVVSFLPEFAFEDTACERFEGVRKQLLLLSADETFSEQERAADEIARFYRGQNR